MAHKNKSKIFKIFSLSLVVFSNLSFANNSIHKNSHHSSIKNNCNTDHLVLPEDIHNNVLTKNNYDALNIDDLVLNFPWLKKYKNDWNFINHGFNAFVNSDLIKKALADQYLLQTIAALKKFQQYIKDTYLCDKHSSLKFINVSFDHMNPTTYIYDEVDPLYQPSFPICHYVTFNENYLKQIQQIEWSLFFDFEKLWFKPDNILIHDFESCFFSDKIDGIYYIEEKDKNDANNPVNLKVKEKIKELKCLMDYCKKQFFVFVDSLEQSSLSSNEKLDELIVFLGIIVTANRENLDHRAIAKDMADLTLEQAIVTSIDHKEFVNWQWNNWF